MLSLLSLLPASLISPLAANAKGSCLPEGAASRILLQPEYPPEWPYTALNFKRFDETPDSKFYAIPRITRHIDRNAIAALRQYYTSTLLPKTSRVLDLCASVESYMPLQWPERTAVVGLGMNETEMAQNPALTSYTVRDLNQNPQLPFDDASFDLVVCALSIDYLIQPRQIVAEVARVLKKNATVAFSFSDRVFATKAVSIWMSGGDQDHIYTVASYFHYTPALHDINVVDLSPRRLASCTGDPLYVVTAKRV